ncbi:uncharacterized protein K489DRAFT_47701 [Dissoconium aciculare CBS 342.82]|uniref:Uncharacterized protein n=1 Tax=Dissoconium aciculare CBS 342.82 TaxID=1314786 RepID=A0A6J3LWJ9_9PEZI|nr:uncharacterized protein K489DRAFT_47701 [Dissoconium aciculare CBS 342.82]KAF1820141.1 hypothetical protein K489DRAFT_47701 [Dissoconium aciculare CBS 342.82]
MPAASRLRSAFRYPSDEDGSDEPAELDEEHQERLIETLAREDAAKNELYRRLFLAIPALGALFFLYTFAFAAATARERLFAVLALTSLVGTAYILHFMPIRREGKGKRPMYKVEADKGPIEKYMIAFQSVLVVLLQLIAAVSWWKGAHQNAYRESLPLVIFALTMFARQQLAPLNMEELHKARYEFKGA